MSGYHNAQQVNGAREKVNVLEVQQYLPCPVPSRNPPVCIVSIVYLFLCVTCVCLSAVLIYLSISQCLYTSYLLDKCSSQPAVWWECGGEWWWGDHQHQCHAAGSATPTGSVTNFQSFIILQLLVTSFSPAVGPYTHGFVLW